MKIFDPLLLVQIVGEFTIIQCRYFTRAYSCTINCEKISIGRKLTFTP